MTIKILHRHAEAWRREDTWSLVAEVYSVDDASDAMASWESPRLSHGDLVRVVGPASEDLFVFDGYRSRFSGVEVDFPSRSVVDLWEGASSNPSDMAMIAAGVSARRATLAACACSESVLKNVLRPGENRPRRAVEAARKLALGIGSARDAEDATTEATNAFDEFSLMEATSYTRSMMISAVEASMYCAMAATKDAGYARHATRSSLESAVYSIRAAMGSSSGMRRATENAVDKARHDMASLVRSRVPLSSLACSIVGARDPLPISRENPRRRR